jgi:hypothetical protein
VDLWDQGLALFLVIAQLQEFRHRFLFQVRVTFTLESGLSLALDITITLSIRGDILPFGRGWRPTRDLVRDDGVLK